MKNKISEFIESLLPADINSTKKENLKLEIENHIFDEIEFYEENGFLMKKVLKKL